MSDILFSPPTDYLLSRRTSEQSAADIEAAIASEHIEYARQCTINPRKQPKVIQIVSNNVPSDTQWADLPIDSSALFQRSDIQYASNNKSTLSSSLQPGSVRRSHTTPTLSAVSPSPSLPPLLDTSTDSYHTPPLHIHQLHNETSLLKCTPSPLYTARLAQKRPSKLSPVTDQKQQSHREVAIPLPDNAYSNNSQYVNCDDIVTPVMSGLELAQHGNDTTPANKSRHNSIQTTASVWSSHNSEAEPLQRTHSNTSSVWSTVCNERTKRQNSNDSVQSYNDVAAHLKHESHALGKRRNTSSCRLSDMQLEEINGGAVDDMQFDVDMNSGSPTPKLTNLGSVWGSTPQLSNMSADRTYR